MKSKELIAEIQRRDPEGMMRVSTDGDGDLRVGEDYIVMEEFDSLEDEDDEDEDLDDDLAEDLDEDLEEDEDAKNA